MTPDYLRSRFVYRDNVYGLLTKCEVKMAEYWPSFFWVFMDRDELEVLKLARKRGHYPAILTEQAWSINDLLYDFWVANHGAQFGSSCPLMELAI